MILYQQINLKIPVDLELQLGQLDWEKLPVASVSKKTDWIQMAYKKKILFELFRYYGWRCQRIGTLLSSKIPIELENQVRAEISQQLNDQLAIDSIIRLQVIYGGEMIPIHTDIARESSIVYPILHPFFSATAFYKSNSVIKRGMTPPSLCTPVDSVSIDNYPVILDVSAPHAIVYGKNTYTKKTPRVSLSIKFKKIDFQTIRRLV
jgi:hypothetical protein